jgi:hypothetical protein
MYMIFYTVYLSRPFIVGYRLAIAIVSVVTVDLHFYLHFKIAQCAHSHILCLAGRLRGDVSMTDFSVLLDLFGFKRCEEGSQWVPFVCFPRCIFLVKDLTGYAHLFPLAPCSRQITCCVCFSCMSWEYNFNEALQGGGATLQGSF